MATVFTILAGLALTLSTVSWGMDVWKAGALESNKSYSAAALEHVRQHQAQAETDLAAARREGDPIAVARTQARRDALVLLEERWDPSAAVRHAEQARSAFIEEGQRKAMIDIGTRIASWGVGGFGRVQGSYMRGTNWPPTGANVVYWDAQAGKAVRVILGTDRPALEIVEFKDNLEDALSMTMGLFDVLKGTAGSGEDALTARETYEGLREGLERLQDLDALPTTIGGYVGRAMERQIQVENSQIASLTEEQREEFVQELACARLQALWQAESDRTRSESYAGALAWFGCPHPVRRTASTEQETEPEQTQPSVQAEEQAPEPVAPPAPLPAGVWVRVEGPVVNHRNLPLESEGTRSDRGDPYTDNCQPSATSLIWHRRSVNPQTGLDYYNQIVEVKPDAPPDQLVPGEVITLRAELSHRGQLPSEGISLQSLRTHFGYAGTAGLSVEILDSEVPGYHHLYTPWEPEVPNPLVVTWALTIPDNSIASTLVIEATLSAHTACNVTWTYRYE